ALAAGREGSLGSRLRQAWSKGMSDRPRIAVVGSGAFGTALAAVVAAKGEADVVLLARRPELAAALRDKRVHERALPVITLPAALGINTDPGCLEGSQTVLFAMPSQAQRDAAWDLAGYLDAGAGVVVCAKGMEKATGRLLTDVVAEELPRQTVAVLSG